MQRLIWAILAAFAMAMVFGPIVIPWLKRLKMGKEIYDLGPQSHMKKQGTPQMGGVIFAVPALIAGAALSYKEGFGYLAMVLVSAVGFGLIGFVDDFIKAKFKKAEGLTPMQKTAPMLVISLGLAIWAYMTPSIGSGWKIPFTDIVWDLGIFYIPLMVFVMLGTVNSANLLDGVDGLLGGCSLFDFVTMALICVTMAAGDAENAAGLLDVAIFAGAMVGGLMGFLRFNSHPARVFMGDVGSFFIGGALVGMTTVTGTTLLLPIIALTMMVSSLSVIIQTTYFKYTRKKTGTGKRIFKMSPLHHHFELSGMPETQIVTMYYLVTVALCLITLLGFVA